MVHLLARRIFPARELPVVQVSRLFAPSLHQIALECAAGIGEQIQIGKVEQRCDSFDLAVWKRGDVSGSDPTIRESVRSHVAVGPWLPNNPVGNGPVI